MKKFILLMLIAYNSQAQTVVVNAAINGINRPFGMAKIGNFIYFSQYTLGKVSKFDYTLANPVVTDIYTSPTGTTTATKLLAVGTDLYVTDFSYDKILKIDTSLPTPVTTTFLTVDGPYSMFLIGNDLYFTSNPIPTNTTDDFIKKVDITASSPVATNVIAIPNPQGITNVGNKVYCSITSATAPIIYSFDLSNIAAGISTVVTNTANMPCLVNNADKIFVGTASGNQLKSFLHASATPNLSLEVTSNSTSITDVLFIGSDMYLSNYATNEIVKYTNFLSTDTFNTTNDFKVFPNPFSDILNIENLIIGDKIEIFNTLGQHVFSGINKNEKTLDVSSITTKGIYFLKINNNAAIKIIKE